MQIVINWLRHRFVVFKVAEMQKELQDLQPQLIVTAEENTKLLAVC